MNTCIRVVLSLIMIVWMNGSGQAGAVAENEVLMRSFLRFSLAQEVRSEALSLAKKLPNNEAGQVSACATSAYDAEMLAVRKELEEAFGQGAREKFGQFVGDYSAAEKAQDRNFLRQLSQNLGISLQVPDYRSLRKLALQQWLTEQMASSSRFLSEIQTWGEVRGREKNVPNLSVWLARNERQISTPAPAQKDATNALAQAEAPLPEFTAQPAQPGNTMDTFSQLRKDKRAQAMLDGQSGMQQMAMERQSAETELGAQKMAKAQAESEAMRAHAQKLAAVENEAMAQRENSWVNRIKQIIGGTVSAGVGAFTGGIGTELGQRVTNELFK